MKLELGKRYVLRCGGVVKIVTRDEDNFHAEGNADNGIAYWKEDGRFDCSDNSPLDIVSEHDPEKELHDAASLVRNWMVMKGASSFEGLCLVDHLPADRPKNPPVREPRIMVKDQLSADNQMIIRNADLTREVAELKATLAQAEITVEAERRSAATWQGVARDTGRNMEWYRGMLTRIGQMLGGAVYIQDDGNEVGRPLYAKIEEVVSDMIVRYREMALQLNRKPDSQSTCDEPCNRESGTPPVEHEG